MSATVHFRRALCRAVEPISFESQVDVYFSGNGAGAEMELTLRRMTTANVAVIDGMLTADFHLNDETFSEPDEVVVVSIIAVGPPNAQPTDGTAIEITGIVLGRHWPADLP